jgi:arginyl-tRNA--protein-N-Asp/Glu arginylyltransferase
MHDPYLRNIQTHHQEVLVEYQRMTQVGSEYQRKHVYRIQCGDCRTHLTNRGMSVSI